MLEYVAPGQSKPINATVFSRSGCPHCARAKALLNEAGREYEALELNKDYSDRTLRAVSAASTFPQVFLEGQLIGGADELEHWLRNQQKTAA